MFLKIALAVGESRALSILRQKSCWDLLIEAAPDPRIGLGSVLTFAVLTLAACGHKGSFDLLASSPLAVSSVFPFAGFKSLLFSL